MTATASGPGLPDLVTAGLRMIVEPWARTGLALESYGADELRTVGGPLIIVVGGSSEADAALVRGALPGPLRRRTVAVESPMIARCLLRLGRAVVLSSIDDAAALAVELGVSVVPVAVRGSAAAFAEGRLWPRRVSTGLPRGERPRVAVRFGRPVGERAVGRLSEQLVATISDLTAEDASTWWAVQRDQSPASTPSTTASGWRTSWQQTEPPLLGGRRARPKIWSPR